MTRRMTRGAAAKPPASLLRLHRHSLSNLVVLGGSDAQRVEIARAFHRASPARGGRFVALDCSHEEGRLGLALRQWLVPAGEAAGPNSLRACESGTLFLDHVESLSAEAQRLLLGVTRRVEEGRVEQGGAPGPLRLAVGSAEDLADAVDERRFLGPLYDSLDKIQIRLGFMSWRGAA
jgi:DNA-binding NtrC family response regulator